MRGVARDTRAWLAVCSSILVCANARAAESTAFAVSIERQPLDNALQELARQCDVQVVFLSRVTEGLSAPALNGHFTLDAAMARLLEGSGLTVRVINPQTVEVRPLQARAVNRRPPPVAVEVGPEEPLQEVVVMGLAEQLVATRIATPLREIPQSVSIVTGEQMRQQNAFELTDALAHVPGMTMDRFNSLEPSFSARGYAITAFHIDGGAAVSPKVGDLSHPMLLDMPDLIEFDHLEILRGSDGLFSGNANPGGTISLVRKRPQRNFALNVDATAGSWGTQRYSMDITGPLAADGALRGRAAAVYGREGYFNDVGAREKKKAFGSLEYNLTPATTLTAGASYQWDRTEGVVGGVPLYRDGTNSRLPRDLTLEFDWSHYGGTIGGAYLQYRQQFTPEWSVKFNVSGWRTKAEFAYGYFQDPIDPFTNEVNAEPVAGFSASPNVHTQKTADVTLTGTQDWFGWREEVAIGADFLRTRLRSVNDGYFQFGVPLRDPRRFDPRDYPDPRLTSPPQYTLGTFSTTDQYGMYASLRVYFNDGWSVVGGARLSGDRTDVRFTTSSQLLASEPLEFSTATGTPHVVTPYAGLMYSFDRHYSLYASYSDIYLSQGSLAETSPGHRLGPRRGINIEAGIKGEWRNGALNGSLAVYRITQTNERRSVSDSSDPNCCVIGVSSESKGVDAELNGELARGWSIGTGYSFNEGRTPERELLSVITPKHLWKLWTNVRLSRWEIGGSVLAQSKTKLNNLDCTLGCRTVYGLQPSYAVLDLRAGFDVDRNWQVAVSVNNLLDKTYYQSSRDRSPYVWYGTPRNWMLRLNGRF